MFLVFTNFHHLIWDSMSHHIPHTYVQYRHSYVTHVVAITSHLVLQHLLGYNHSYQPQEHSPRVETKFIRKICKLFFFCGSCYTVVQTEEMSSKKAHKNRLEMIFYMYATYSHLLSALSLVLLTDFWLAVVEKYSLGWSKNVDGNSVAKP